MSFSASCVTPKDNSVNVAMAVDNYILTKPSKAQCPNRYVTKSLLTSYATETVEKIEVAKQEIRILEDNATPVEFITADFQGEEYRRLIEPMPQFVAEAVTCATSQVQPRNEMHNFRSFLREILTV